MSLPGSSNGFRVCPVHVATELADAPGPPSTTTRPTGVLSTDSEEVLKARIGVAHAAGTPILQCTGTRYGLARCLARQESQ
jgi:hypothetical protein